MKTFFKKNYKYLVVFILIFLFYYFIDWTIFYGDSLNNYGFSHAIKMGEIPYRDFNMVSTPLYPFIMSLGLHIFDNHLTFIIEQSILFTIMFYFLYKIFDKKSYLIIASFFSFGAAALNTTYNFFTLFILTIILYLEKNHKEKDYIIGFLIGLAILTKHTIGCLYALPTIIIYYKDVKKILRRAIGAFIPGIVFITYLLINKTLYNFIDLCFLGLFDFGSKNKIATFFLLPSIIAFLISLYFIKKDKKNILNYYSIFSISFIIPIFDIHHFSLYFVAFMMLLIQYVNNKVFNRVFYVFCLAWFFVLSSSLFTINFTQEKKFKHLEFLYTETNKSKRLMKTYEYLNNWDNPILLSIDTMHYDISNNREINYYSVFLNGNYGYNGSKKMIDRIKKEHDRYIIVKKVDYLSGKYNDTQVAYEICDYVMNNTKFIEEKYGYRVYYKE